MTNQGDVIRTSGQNTVIEGNIDSDTQADFRIFLTGPVSLGGSDFGL